MPKIATNFEVGSAQPIDTRFVVQSESDLANLKVYEGLEVYIKDLKAKRLYNGTDWVEASSSYSKSFTGTFAEYETASANGLIPNGMIVYILDDDDDVVDEPVVDDRTSSLLGTGVLGYMILG